MINLTIALRAFDCNALNYRSQTLICRERYSDIYFIIDKSTCRVDAISRNMQRGRACEKRNIAVFREYPSPIIRRDNCAERTRVAANNEALISRRACKRINLVYTDNTY